MSRLPIKPRDQLQGERLEAYDNITKIAEDSFGDNGAIFKYKNEEGGLLGPFAFALAEPKSGAVFMDLVTKLAQIKIPPKAKETAILATGGHYKAAYELYAHAAVGEKAGLSKAQVDSIIAGKKPEGLDAACSAAYDAALYLSSTPGPLPKDIFDALDKDVGREGTVGLIHYIGYYAYVCVILNATDAQVPS